MRAMGVRVLVLVLVVVVRMGMSIRLGARRGIRIGGLVCELHIHFDSGNVRLLPARQAQVPSVEFESFQLALQGARIDPEVDHRTDEHVAADAAEDVEVESFHKLKLPRTRFRRNSKLQAPIFTAGVARFWKLVFGAWSLELPGARLLRLQPVH